jgi:hypothetical protein
MNKIYFGVLLLLSQLTFPALGCDFKALNSEVESIHNKIWSNKLISEDSIKESIDSFASNRSQEQIMEISDFNVFYRSTVQGVEDKFFINFAENCRKLYEKENKFNKVRIYLLLKEVSRKFIPLYSRNKKFKEWDKENIVTDNELLNVFLHPDKKICISK